jgi:hypothetical protein
MKKSEMEKIFRKLSLQIRSTGHNYGWLVRNGKKILRVHYSHGKGDIPEKITNKIRGQLKLSQKDFRDLIKCPFTLEEYTNILKQKGFID